MQGNTILKDFSPTCSADNTYLQPRGDVLIVVQGADMLQNGQDELELVHAAAIVHIGQEVELLL